MWEISEKPLSTEEEKVEIKNLAEVFTIDINCSAISVVSICALRSLSKKLNSLGSTQLKIRSSAPNGREQLNQISKDSHPVDFLIVPNDPFFLAPYSITKEFRFLGPVNGEIQHVYRKKSSRVYSNSRILTFFESSAEFHLRSGQGVPRAIEPEIIENAGEIPLRLNDMAGGNYVFAWEPLSLILDELEDFEKIPGSTHYVEFSLYCHKSWRNSKRKKQLSAFIKLFQNEWLRCVESPKEAIAHLQYDWDYLVDFASGCGITLNSNRFVDFIDWGRQRFNKTEQN